MVLKNFAALVWLFGGSEVVLGGRNVAYHRVCCRQDADVKVQTTGQKLVPALEHLITQFDSDYCVHTFGSGICTSKDGVWPCIREDEEGFESHYKPLRSRSERRRSGSGRRRSSRSGSLERWEMKCATVEVLFKTADAEVCPLDVFTPAYLFELSMENQDARIGTGKGSWNGKSIVDYVQDEHHLKIEDLNSKSPMRSPVDISVCESIVSKPMIESAVNKLGLSLDAKGVVHLLEYATNSRAPTSNIYVPSEEVEYSMTTTKLKGVNMAEIISIICQKLGHTAYGTCLEAVPIKLLKPAFERKGKSVVATGLKRIASSVNGVPGLPFGSRSSSSKTVNILALKDRTVQQSLAMQILELTSYHKVESRNCRESSPTRFLDFVLMRAFLAVSGTPYAELHNRSVERRLSTSTHWILAACASKLVIRRRTPKKDELHRFLHDYFAFELQKTVRISFMESATLADVDTEGIESPICAVLAGEQSLHVRKSEGRVDVLVAYFTREKKGEERVVRSGSDKASPWEFFHQSDRVDLLRVLRDAALRIEEVKKSPPVDFGVAIDGDLEEEDLLEIRDDFPRFGGKADLLINR